MSIINQVSPGFQVNEIEVSSAVSGVSTSTGAFVGQFAWGPCDTPLLIADESSLVRIFGQPTANVTESFIGTSFFSAANFLAYSNSLYNVRTVSANSATNSTSNAASLLIKNETSFANTYLNNNNNNTYGAFAAKYPGKYGNSLTVSVCANTSQFSAWNYSKYFTSAPNTSSYITSTLGKTNVNDEMHVIVVDTLGQFSGVANTVLEIWPFMSKAFDAVDINGTSSYYKNVLMNSSNYIYAVDPVDYANTATGNTAWGSLSTDVNSFASPSNYTIQLSGGSNGSVPSDGELENNWMKLSNRNTYDYSLAFVGASSPTVANYVLSNIIQNGDVRGSVLFASPRYQDVVFSTGNELNNIINNFLPALNASSSYLILDSGWKYQYDKYANTYRWIPLNADIAGLCAYTDSVTGPWYSPAGVNRGNIKNVTKLSWNPNKAERDSLYTNGINPVISMQGQGTVLWGDKTALNRPSVWDRIGVRRLFCTIEKAIEQASLNQMFEFNDAFSQAAFITMIDPYLRLVQGGRGIVNYKVVCDSTNNTAGVVSANGFVGDIYILPNNSTNYIQLNFYGTKSSTVFNYITGQTS
jgi:Phage tail sheath protein subtilisin-like domain/Phage tail sheath C-terminal domain